jgi:hypothetical protein
MDAASVGLELFYLPKLRHFAVKIELHWQRQLKLRGNV